MGVIARRVKQEEKERMVGLGGRKVEAEARGVGGGKLERRSC